MVSKLVEKAQSEEINNEPKSHLMLLEADRLEPQMRTPKSQRQGVGTASGREADRVLESLGTGGREGL